MLSNTTNYQSIMHSKAGDGCCLSGPSLLPCRGHKSFQECSDNFRNSFDFRKRLYESVSIKVTILLWASSKQVTSGLNRLLLVSSRVAESKLTCGTVRGYCFTKMDQFYPVIAVLFKTRNISLMINKLMVFIFPNLYLLVIVNCK